MKNTYFKNFKLTIFAFCLPLVGLFAQTNLTFYNNRSVAQSSLLNPAHFSRQGFTLGILDLGQQTYVPGLTLYDLMRADETSNQTINKFLSDDSYHFNDIRNSIEVNPLFIGFRAKRNYFSLGFQVVTDQDLDLPKGLFQMFYLGNTPSQTFGKPIEFNGTKADITSYAAIHGSYAREINDKLTIGIRGKYLLGLFDLRINKANGYFVTDSGEQNVYKFEAEIDYEVNASGIDRIEEFSNNTSPSNGTNFVNQYLRPYYADPLGKGFAFDLGFNYRLNNKFSFSGSVIDLGTINWTQGKTYSKNAKFTYEGLNEPDFDSTDALINELADSIGTIFKPNESSSPYKTNLNTKIYIGADYQVFNSGKLGIVGMSEFHKKKVYLGAGLNYTQRVWRILDIRAGLTYFGDIGTNLGMGLNLHLGPLVIYGSTDKLLGSVNYETTHFISNRIGININIGGRYDRDNDGIPDKKDQCKKVPGLAKFDGCPDRDGDGVPDPSDECVDVKGTIAANGCPDMDGDGIKDLADSCMSEKGDAKLFGCPDKDNDGVADKYDACPEDSGMVSRDGCPDRDGDGVLDKADVCPDVAGPKFTMGCPDMDRDSIPDNEDECPGVPGLRQFKGCPDLDGDGIPNKNDSCIGDAGPAATFGCPDTDGDGIADKYDNCPTEAGNLENQGCPTLDSSLVVLTEEEKKVLKEAFSNLEFESGTAKIAAVSIESLHELAELLNTRTEYKLEINGHTDNSGKAATNKKLSQDRANAVKTYLASQGVAADRMTAKGFGSSKPIAENKTAAGRQKNRRVEFKIIK